MIKIENEQGINLKCQRCGNEWTYKGKNDWFATCTRCAIKVSVRKNRIE